MSKRIAYISPVKWMRGSLSGRQNLTYEGGSAYDVTSNTKVSADAYAPRIIAKVLREPYASRIKYYQVRTKTSVHMTAANRHNLALMAGVGALMGGLLSDKTAIIYQQCLDLVPRGYTLRAFLSPKLRAGLNNKDARIIIADGIYIVNPWRSTETPNVQVNTDVLAKYQSELA